jgi:hypothetical protein
MQFLEINRRAIWLTGLFLMMAVLAADNAAGAEAAAASPNSDSNDLLLNLFIEKGYVSKAEAEKVKAEAEKRKAELEQYKAEAQALQTETAELKAEVATLRAQSDFGGTNYMPELSKPKTNVLDKMVFFGDVRLRYEDRSATDSGGNRIDLQRMRYALRGGVRGDLSDDFNFGFRLETGASPRSSWVSMGTSSSSSPYQGPYGKSNAGINIGQIYLSWHPEDWVNMTVGKMPNPIYTTPLLWSGSLNPEGAAEQFKYTVGEADFFANFGQFLYADFNPENASSGLGINGGLGQSTQNIFMFAWQGGLNYHITTDTSAKIAATLYSYAGLQRSSINSGSSTAPYFGDPYVGEGAYYYNGGKAFGYAPGYAGYAPGSTFGLPGYYSQSYTYNQVGLDNLLVVEVPFELNFKINQHLAARLFGDVAYNLDGAQRAEEAAAAYSYISSQAPPTQNAISHSFPAQTKDVKAYQIGFGIGSTNFVSGPMQGVVYGNSGSKHAWEFRTYWQHIEQYSLDPNLLDSDFFEGRENMQGFYAALAYCFSGNVYGTVRYGYARRINDLLGTGGSNQDIPQMNPINDYSLFQVDLGVRF